MSYGQPWSNTTAGPPAGPVSTYPTFRTPASICLSESNDEFALAPPPAAVLGGPSCWFASVDIVLASRIGVRGLGTACIERAVQRSSITAIGEMSREPLR